jgi:hypothetical protein
MICGVPSVKKTIRGIVFRRARGGREMFKIKFLSNIVLGILLGSIFAFSIALVFDADIQDGLKKFYTSLLTSITTVIAAVFALSGVLANIDNQNIIANQSKSRSLAAAKAVLPLALSQMSAVARRGSSISLDISTSNQSAELLISQLKLPAEIIPAIRDSIQHSNQCNGERLANLIRTYQVLFSRSERWLREAYRPLLQQYDNSVDWAIFYRLVEDCYEYARAESQDIPVELSDPKLQGFFAVIMRVSPSDLAQVMPAILRREEAGRFEIF